MNSTSGVPTRSSKKSGYITKNYNKVLEKYKNDKRILSLKFKSCDYKNDYSSVMYRDTSDDHRFKRKLIKKER